ncbi:hypothetical protein D9M69_704150 [compost metagenome]
MSTGTAMAASAAHSCCDSSSSGAPPIVISARWRPLSSLASTRTARPGASACAISVRRISMARNRSVGLNTLPMAVSGSDSTSTTRFGQAGRSYTCGATSRNSASASSTTPARSTTKATGTSPA